MEKESKYKLVKEVLPVGTTVTAVKSTEDPDKYELTVKIGADEALLLVDKDVLEGNPDYFEQVSE